jgi:hypothetical protein
MLDRSDLKTPGMDKQRGKELIVVVSSNLSIVSNFGK